MRGAMEEASASEAPVLTGAMRLWDAARSRQLHLMLVLSCLGGGMGVMEDVLDGEGSRPGGGYVTRMILDHVNDVQGGSSTS